MQTPINNTIQLNGQTYTLGTPAISIGFNMACKYVVSKCTLHYTHHDGYFLKSGGISVKVMSADLTEYYIDTPANRKTLKEIINNTYYNNSK